MKFFVITLLIMASTLASAAGETAVNADSIKIELTADDCDPDHAELFIMDFSGDLIVIQDLFSGRMVVADSESGKNQTVYTFPEMLLSLYFADTGSVYALTRSGFAEFDNLGEAITWLQQEKPTKLKVLELQNINLLQARFDYRLLVDRTGKIAVWNRSESLLKVFGNDGSFIDAFPCQNKPVLTGRDSFISSYFSPQFATRIVETGFNRPVANGEQQEVDSLLVELQQAGEFHLFSFDAVRQTFRGLLLPPSLDNIALENGIHDVADDAQATEGKVAQDYVEADSSKAVAVNQEFGDPADPGKTVMFYCSVDTAGKVSRLMQFTDSFFSDKIKEKNGVVYFLVPAYETATDSISLSALQIMKYRVTPK